MKFKVAWTADTKAAFEEAKQFLHTATKLHHYCPDKPLHLYTDSSSVCYGAYLCQPYDIDGKIVNKPLGFFSKMIPANLVNKSIYEKEMRSVIHGLNYFHHTNSFLHEDDHHDVR